MPDRPVGGGALVHDETLADRLTTLLHLGEAAPHSAPSSGGCRSQSAGARSGLRGPAARTALVLKDERSVKTSSTSSSYFSPFMDSSNVKYLSSHRRSTRTYARSSALEKCSLVSVTALLATRPLGGEVWCI